MQISVAPERIFVFSSTLSVDEAETIASAKKGDAFGTFNKFASFLSKTNDDDYEIVYREKRLVPFWHLVCKSHYVFERTVEHKWPVPKPEVTTVTIEGKTYPVEKNHISVSALEHCEENISNELMIDNTSPKPNAQLKHYFTYLSTEVNDTKLAELSKEKTVVIPPSVRASALVNDQMAALIHSVHADKIFEESVEITHLDLYYRPTFAFEFLWKSKDKKSVIEVDGLTSQVQFGNQLFKQYLGKVLDADFLFDIGADAAGMVLPGGSIAVKMAKKYLTIKK